jgi:hypothetical protein
MDYARKLDAKGPAADEFNACLRLKEPSDLFIRRE